MNQDNVVFDAYAILALLGNEAGADIVAEILVKATNIYISAMNLGEIYYIVLRRNGEQKAAAVIQSILLDDTFKIMEASWDNIKKAALIKADGGLSFADSFALAAAQTKQAPLVTGDPEIKAKASRCGVEIIWIR